MSVEEVPSAASLENFRGRKRAVDDSWKKIQERVFKNWMNDRLRGNLKVAQRQVRESEQQRWTAFSCWSSHLHETCSMAVHSSGSRQSSWP